jgi:protein TonB
VVAVKQRLPEGSVATIVNPGNARSAEGTVLWCDGSSAEIEFREAIPTFWQPEAGTSSAPVRTSPEAPREVPPAKQSDVVSIAESIDFAKPVELKLVPPSSSSPEATSAAAQLFGEQTYQRRNVRPFVIAITAIALLSGIGTSGIVLSKLHQGAALPSLPVSLPMEKTEAVQPSPVSPNPTSIAVQGVAETKLESTARHASTAPSAAVVAVNAPSKIITAANEGPAPDASSDFAISMPAPPPVISSAVKNVVLAAPDPVHYTAAKPISTPQPAYPEGAKRMGAEGDVVVNVEIDASGQVTATRARSGHPLLIEPAVSAARLWKFEPATRNGKPIASLKTLRFHFTAH